MTKVLIVDDEPAMREILVRWLTPAGYHTLEAGDAMAGLEIAKTSGADVVLCDITMPGKDGFWLVAMLRAHLPTAALVLATAVDEMPGGVSLQEGVAGYLLKPFSKERVLEAVRDALAWRQHAIARSARPQPSGDSVEHWLNEDRRPVGNQDE